MDLFRDSIDPLRACIVVCIIVRALGITGEVFLSLDDPLTFFYLWILSSVCLNSLLSCSGAPLIGLFNETYYLVKLSEWLCELGTEDHPPLVMAFCELSPLLISSVR